MTRALEDVWTNKSIPNATLIIGTIWWARHHNKMETVVWSMAFATTLGGAMPVLVPLATFFLRWYLTRQRGWWLASIAVLAVAPFIGPLHPIWTHIALMAWCDQWTVVFAAARHFKTPALLGLLFALIVAVLNHLIGLFIVVVLLAAPVRTAFLRVQRRL